MPGHLKMKVGLALGGGAARGMAHVGVLRVFEREKLQIDVVSGTSMGAIIGGAYFALGDSGELVAAVHTLGIPHPSGYPLYVLLGKLFSMALPIGSIAFRMSLFSAVCAAAAGCRGYAPRASHTGS